MQVFANGKNDFVADTQNGGLFGRAQPQMAVVHQKFRAVFFGGDGVILGHLQNFQVLYAQFISQRGAFVLAYGSGNKDRRFLGYFVAQFKLFGGNVPFKHNALNNAAAVAQLQEMQFAAGAFVVQPAF